MNMIKQIETKKCPVCGYYTAIHLFKEGKCNVCFALTPEQQVTENKPTDTNNDSNKNNV